MDTTTTDDRSAARKVLRSVTCPHCWHNFHSSDIVWVAQHEDLRGDPVLGRDAYLRFLPTRFNVDGDALDSRGMPCRILACPNCHLEIDRVFLNYPAFILSLIGGTFSGKSYYLTSAAWELARLLPQQFLLIFKDLDSGNNATLIEYQKALFLHDNPDQPVGLQKTQPDSASHYDSANLDGQSMLLPRPFLFSLTPERNHPHADRPERHSRVLCLYDNAGEHFIHGEDTPLTPVTRHVAQSKLLMFLYDPTQDPRMREKCTTFSDDPQLSTHTKTQLQTQILIEAATRVRRYAHLSQNEKLSQPLLVLVSKSDIWCNLIDEDITSEPYIAAAPPERLFAVVDAPRIMRVSTKIRNLLLELAPEFVAAAEDFCKEVLYIPVSALGCSPEVQEGSNFLVVRPRNIKPRWVTVPVMYAFSAWASGLARVQCE